MRFTGPHNITKTIQVEVTCPDCGHSHVHDKVVFDNDAYWRLDHWGEQDEEGTNFYAKVAFPTLAAAVMQHRLEAAAIKAERAEGERQNKEWRKRQREERKQRAEERRKQS